jgi:hypothetical protein
VVAKKTLSKSSRGQALSELIIGLFAFGILLYGVALIGDLGRARLQLALECRKDVGRNAMDHIEEGSPILYGEGEFSQSLESEVFDSSEYPVSYSKYAGPNYSYIRNNFVEPVARGHALENFHYTAIEKSKTIDNNPFLRKFNVGADEIELKEKACMPVLSNFDSLK